MSVAMPAATTYEKGLKFWPYEKSLELVLKKVVELAPPNGFLADLMCGPGYLLGQIKEIRPDLNLLGVDIDEKYVEYGRSAYPGVSFEHGDILSWKTIRKFETIICTGALHHIPYEQQEVAIANLASFAVRRGKVIISDCYIDDYSSETARQLAAAHLGYEYLKATIERGAPADVIEWTIDILRNDVLMKEFKTSFLQREPLLKKYFKNVETELTWPDQMTGPEDFCDLVHICTCH